MGKIQIDNIGRVLAEAQQAIDRRVRININASQQLGISPDAGAERQMKKALRAYKKLLRILERAFEAKNKHQVRRARRRITESFPAKLIATVRATKDKKELLPFAELESRAKSLSLYKAYHETVAVVPMPGNKPGSWRPISWSGIQRRAQQLILRDMLLVTVGDSECDSTVPGAGGEVRAFQDIKKAIADGFHFWASLDVRNFFPSLRPGHLEELPLSEWAIRNLVFLPSDTPIRFFDPSCSLVITEEAILKGETPGLPRYYPHSLDSIGWKLKQVRQGLLQGDVCVPQIARMVLGRELQLALEGREVVYGSHLDDIIIGARSHAELKTSIKALAHRLTSHPAGPLELHEHEIRHIKDDIYYLGYRVSLRANGQVHVRPALKRFDRFRSRLWERLRSSESLSKQELLKVAIRYGTDWFRAQPAWTQTEFSWAYVLFEIRQCLNIFIYHEWMEGYGFWHESDIDWNFIEED